MKISNLSQIGYLYDHGVRIFELSGLYKASKPGWALLDFGPKFKEPIVLKANKGKRAILDGSGKVGHVLSIRGRAQVRLENLEIRGGSTASHLWPSFLVTSPFRHSRSIYNFIDGAGILILDRAKVEIMRCRLVKNEAYMCGGGVSIQQSGKDLGPVVIKDCEISNNQAGDTGSAIDLLTPSSKAEIIKTKIASNRSNLIDPGRGKSGQVTAFPKTEVIFKNCQITGRVNVPFPGLIYGLKHAAKTVRAYLTFWRVSYPWVG